MLFNAANGFSYGEYDYYEFGGGGKRSGQKMDPSVRGMLQEMEDGAKDLHYLRFGKRGDNNNNNNVNGLSDYLVRPGKRGVKDFLVRPAKRDSSDVAGFLVRPGKKRFVSGGFDEQQQQESDEMMNQRHRRVLNNFYARPT